MNKIWSILFGVVAFLGFALFVIAPIVGWWLPKDISTFGGEVDFLFYMILAITAFFYVLTEAILVYNMYRFEGQAGRKAPFVHGSHRLEVLWTAVPAVILVIIAVSQISAWERIKYQKNMPAPNGETQQMEVSARQWEWRIRYPNVGRIEDWQKTPDHAKDFGASPHQDDIHLVNQVHVYQGQKVLVHLKTRDVIHSFFLPNLRLKQDALPGKTIPVWFEVDNKQDNHNVEFDEKTGKLKELEGRNWELACAEYCGTRHSMMRGRLYVHKDKAEYLKWLRHVEKEQRRTNISAP